MLIGNRLQAKSTRSIFFSAIIRTRHAPAGEYSKMSKSKEILKPIGGSYAIFKRTFVVHAGYGAGRGRREKIKRQVKTNVSSARKNLSRRELFSVYGGEPVYRTGNTSRETRPGTRFLCVRIMLMVIYYIACTVTQGKTNAEKQTKTNGRAAFVRTPQNLRPSDR